MLGRTPPRRKFSLRRPAPRPLRGGKAALIGTRACRLQRRQRCLNRHEDVPAPKTATLLTIGTRACRLQRRQRCSFSARHEKRVIPSRGDGEGPTSAQSLSRKSARLRHHVRRAWCVAPNCSGEVPGRRQLLARFFLEAVVGQFGTVLYLAADVRRFHEPNPSGIPGSSDQRDRCARDFTLHFHRPKFSRPYCNGFNTDDTIALAMLHL